MMTDAQLIEARKASDTKFVRVRFLAVQTWPGHNPIPLFNVVDGDYCAGSTVRLASLLKAGYRVEVIE